MNKKHGEKKSFEGLCAIVPIHSYMWKTLENNLPRRPGNNRILLGILLVCIVGITGGCSSGEVNEVKQSEMSQVNQESSEIDGQWFGFVDGMDGKPLELKYRFRAEGTRLIGLIESQLGGGQISDGKIDGNNIEFKLITSEFTILNNGTLSGDEIQLTETVGEEKIKVVLKRVKS